MSAESINLDSPESKFVSQNVISVNNKFLKIL